MMLEDEIYPNTPIVDMIAEIRFSQCEPLDRIKLRGFTTALGERLLLLTEETGTSVQLSGPDGQVEVPVTNGETFPRWSSRDRRTVLTLRQNILSLETTDYPGYFNVRELLEKAVTALERFMAPKGVTRIGLRYIDEIRVPSDGEDPQPRWEDWVNLSLLGPKTVSGHHGLTLLGNQGIAVFGGEEGTTLVLRYGTQDEYVIPSTPQLRRPMPSPGPLFKLDMDSFQTYDDYIPPFEAGDILETADLLHKPVKNVFEDLITERLREEVLRHE
ncbi:TIGR04255 family protein [Bifidobacterium longum]|uniref:TIGR04255 family protein n=2 Tax=Bifidobacterium longum TaxID=216816 RepID=UPI002072B7D8|nr:TIGR04255 family protein [Bifidobacterium longum]